MDFAKFVKPLEWRIESRSGWKAGVCYAAGIYIMRMDTFSWRYDGVTYARHTQLEALEAAKAAAQSDYAARILSALDLPALQAAIKEQPK